MRSLLGAVTRRGGTTIRPLARRALVVVGATLLFTAGFAGLVLPLIPGLVFLAGGAALLAREFSWAARLLARLREPPLRLRDRAEEPSPDRRAA